LLYIKFKSKLSNAFIWNGTQIIINQSFSIIIKLILVKLLIPEDFGIIGMATVFTGFVTIISDFGIGDAIIQTKENNLNNSYLNTAFWTGITWAITLYTIMSLFIAPIASSFYNENILRVLIPILSLGILASPFNVVNKSLLIRKLNFKSVAIAQNSATIMAGILSLSLALYGAGVWSLAFNSISEILITLPIYFYFSNFRPTFHWDKINFRKIFSFSSFSSLTKIVNYWISNLDYLIIGKFLGPAQLGIYTLAFFITSTVRDRIMNIINNVMYPVYGNFQDSKNTVKQYYLNVIKINSILISPLMLIIIFYSKSLINYFLDNQWKDAVIPMQILSISTLVHLLVNSNTVLIRGLGYPRLEFSLQLVKAIIFIPVLIFSIVYNGIIGAAYAVLINKIISVFLVQFILSKENLISLKLLEYINSIKIPLISTLLTSISVYLFNEYLNTNIIIGILILVIIYTSTVYILFKYYGELDIVKTIKEAI